MKTKKKEDFISLLNQEEIALEAKAAADISRVCKKNNVALSQRYERLLKMLQIKEVAVSMFIRLFEVETLFEGEIKEFFKKK